MAFSSSLVVSLWTLIALAFSAHCELKDEIQFGELSFTLKTTIKPVIPFGESKILRVTEEYSKEQMRARIQYHSTDGDDGLRTFYYNDNSLTGIQYTVEASSEDTCKKTSKAEFQEGFYKGFQALGKSMSSLNLQTNSHIVGPAKLLLLIAGRTELLKRISQEPTKFLFTGQQDLIQFELDSLPGFDTIQIYYDAASLSLKPTPGAHLPKLITIPSAYVVIHYSRFEIHPPNEDKLTERQMDSNKIELDRFAFPASEKCFGQLPNYEMFALYSMDAFRVSFAATSEDAMNMEEEHLVEFDGLRQVMRIDKLNHGTGHSTIDILDYRMDRRYLIWADSPAGEAECIMMKNMGDRRSNVKMAELLVGGAKYSLLGRAKVRGIEALVYSAATLNLPFWYDKPLVHKRNAIDWLRHRGHTVYSMELGSTVGFYTLVYVNEAIEEGVKLLAMEVMQANGMHLLTVHFHDFAWHLSEPASGLAMDHLFAPIEACSAGARDDNYVDVSILLEQDKPAANESAPPKQADWLEDWPSRDAALLASLSDSLEIDVTMIHEFESTVARTAGPSPQYKIDVHFRLSERPLLLHELNYVGGANIQPNHKYQDGGSELLLKTNVQTLRDCMDLIEPSDSLSYVYYSELESTCIVDLRLRGLEEEKLQLLDLLSPKGKPSVGELYQVVAHKDSVSYMTTLLRDETVFRLEGRLLVLSHAQAWPGLPNDPAVLEVRIKHMKLRNVNFMQRAKNRGPGRGMLSGYGLAPTTAGNNNTYVLPSGGGPKTLADCQTACTVDYNCETLSFCVYFPETECTLSSAPYHLIEARTSNPNDTKEKNVADQQPTYKLRKDFRCEIHRNHHLEYFYSKAEPYVTLDVFQVQPVADSEECARTCIQQTISELRQQVQLQQTLHDHSGVGLEQHAEFIDQYKERMRNVCQQYLYMQAPLEQIHRDVIKYHLEPELKPLADSHTGGYCLFDQSTAEQNSDHRRSGNSPYRYVLFRADLYELDFSKLYRRESGFVLKGSSSTREEQDARVTFSFTRSDQKAELLRRLDSEGKNLQFTVHADETRCAQMCFFQYAGLCRSFDTYQETLIGGGRINKCNLNSQSVRKYENSGKDVEDLKDRESESLASTWHYELKWDLIVRPLAQEQSSGERSQVSLGGFAVSLVVIASLLSGLAFGWRLGERLSPRRRFPSIPIIVDPISNNQQQLHDSL